MEKDIVVSFSGGKSSAYLCWLMENHHAYKHRKKHYVFANTGRELTATIVFARGWMRDYLEVSLNVIEAKIYPDERKSTGFTIVDDWNDISMDGEPFEAVISKYGLPSIAFPHCTRELKINPIKAFIREHLGLQKDEYVEAIGMRFDEPKRVKNDPNYIYPLYDLGVTKQHVNDFFQEDYHRREIYGLQIEEFEGNCDFCYKKSHSKLMKMFAKHSSRFLWWDDMQEKYWELDTEIFRGKKLSRDLLIEGLDNKDAELEKDYDCACGRDW